MISYWCGKYNDTKHTEAMIRKIREIPGEVECEVIPVSQQKDSIGKTFSALSISAALSQFYKKDVLIIDMDPQGDISQALGIDVSELKCTVLDLF